MKVEAMDVEEPEQKPKEEPIEQPAGDESKESKDALSSAAGEYLYN